MRSRLTGGSCSLRASNAQSFFEPRMGFEDRVPPDLLDRSWVPMQGRGWRRGTDPARRQRRGGSGLAIFAPAGGELRDVLHLAGPEEGRSAWQ